MKTESNLTTAKKHGLWSFCGLVQSFDFWGKGRPVTFTVKALGIKKGSGAMSGTATDFSNFSKIRLEGRRGDPID